MKTAAELAEEIRTYGWWQGPDETLDELVRRLELAEAAVDGVISVRDHSSGEDGWSDAEAMYDHAYEARCRR